MANNRAKILLERKPRIVTNDEFWALIDTIDRTALMAGEEGEEEAVAPLITALAALDRPQLEAFEEHLALALYALDGEVYADAAGESGESGDGFLYARCHVVARGKAFYEKVLAQPSMMPDSLDMWLESLLFVAAQAWEESSGEDFDQWHCETSASYETGSNEAQW